MIANLLKHSASIAAAVILIGTGIIHSQQTKIPDQEIPRGWYKRADSKADGPLPSETTKKLGETSIRCLCADGFRGRFDGLTFVVTAAPEGYEDTIGRRFVTLSVNCLNCRD